MRSWSIECVSWTIRYKCAFVLLALLTANLTAGQTYIWDYDAFGALDNDFDISDNWDPIGIPDSPDIVVLLGNGLGPSGEQLHQFASHTISGLRAAYGDSRLHLNGKNLRVNGAFYVNPPEYAGSNGQLMVYPGVAGTVLETAAIKIGGRSDRSGRLDLHGPSFTVSCQNTLDVGATTDSQGFLFVHNGTTLNTPALRTNLDVVDIQRSSSVIISNGATANVGQLDFGMTGSANGILAMNGTMNLTNTTGTSSVFGQAFIGQGATMTSSHRIRIRGGGFFVWNNGTSLVTEGLTVAGSSILFVLNESEVSCTDSFIVGENGEGQVLVDAASSLITSNAVIGQGVAADANVDVFSLGASWTSDSLVVGDSGAGELLVGHQATSTHADMTLGYSAGATGVLRVRNTNSQVTVNGDAKFGPAGSADVYVTEDGLLRVNGNIEAGDSLGGAGNADMLVASNGMVRMGIAATGSNGSVRVGSSGGVFNYLEGGIHVTDGDLPRLTTSASPHAAVLDSPFELRASGTVTVPANTVLSNTTGRVAGNEVVIGGEIVMAHQTGSLEAEAEIRNNGSLLLNAQGALIAPSIVNGPTGIITYDNGDASMYLIPELVNNGLVAVTNVGGDGLLFASNAVLTGTGHLTLDNDHRLGAEGSSLTLLNETDHTVNGHGVIDPTESNDFTFVNSGSLEADIAGEALILGQSTAFTHTNIATIQASAGGVFRLGGLPGPGTIALHNLGTLAATGGGHLDLMGNIDGNGKLVASNGTATVYAGVSNFYGKGSTVSTGGLLTVDGSLDGSIVSVTADGTLGGTGTIHCTVTVDPGGQIAPGASAGNLTVVDDVTLNGTLNIEIGGTTAGTGYDRLQVSGNAELDGTLRATLIDGFVPGTGDVFVVLTYGTRSNTFANIDLPAPLEGTTWDVSYGSTSVTLTAAAFTDTDGDDMDDNWETDNLGSITNSDGTADTDGDGLTDFDEYIVLTDPDEASSVLRISAIEPDGSKVAVLFPSVNGVFYRVDGADNAITNPWTERTNTTGDGTELRVPGLSKPLEGPVFYRLEASR